MQRFFHLFLVATLLACPALCRIAEDPCCPTGGVVECSQDPGHSAPEPLDDDDCLCSGTALKADDGSAAKIHSLLSHALPFPIVPTPILAAPELAQGLTNADPAGRPRPVRLHLLLEIHRC